MKGLLGLVGGTFALWAPVTYAAGRKWPGDPTFLWSTTAALLCLVPTALTLLWTTWAYKGKAEEQLLAVMGGTAVRLACVLLVGMVLFLNVPDYEYQRFWLFVIGYYLFTLGLEMVLVVRGASAPPAQQN